MSLWLIIFGMGIITLGIRVSFFTFLSQSTLPTRFQNALRFVPVAVLAGLVAPELISVQVPYPEALENGRLIAGMLAAVVAWYTKNALLTVFIGMSVLLTIQYIFQ